MDVSLNDWLPDNPLLAGIISILLNIVVAITGVLPSAFITIGTVGVLGLYYGLIVLIIGEAMGAVISFILYRKGVNKLSAHSKFMNNKFLQRLKDTGGGEAFLLVILLRLLPFVPSGLVTLTASFSKMSLQAFAVASTIGKIPALFIEAYTVYYVLRIKEEWTIVVVISAIILVCLYKILYKKEH